MVYLFIQQLMCEKDRSNEIYQLITVLHKKWSDSFEAHGNTDDTKLWGRAYKKANEIEKHGGTLKLPIHLYRELSDKQQKYVLPWDGAEDLNSG